MRLLEVNMTDEEFVDLVYNLIYLARRVGRNEDIVRYNIQF